MFRYCNNYVSIIMQYLLICSKLHANLMYCIMSPDDVNYEIHSLECQKTPRYTTDAVITTNGISAISLACMYYL